MASFAPVKGKAEWYWVGLSSNDSPPRGGGVTAQRAVGVVRLPALFKMRS
jgi:hypothetical protein